MSLLYVTKDLVIKFEAEKYDFLFKCGYLSEIGLYYHSQLIG